MKKVLILGAGLVAKPLVRYLLQQPDLQVKVASRTVGKAEKLIEGHPRGAAKELDLKNEGVLNEEVKWADLVISMVPYTFHPKVAEFCIAHKKHMVTTSYVSEAMKKLDVKAREAGIIILNELGLDPGIDHMEAMRVIDEVKKEGGEIQGFVSFCGGLPAPEANTNPFGYKFSWSPVGVLLAGKNSAQYLKDGREIFIPSENLFENYDFITIKGLGVFEGYPNRNSLPYISLYGIPEAKTMLRGTLRYVGWCETIKKMVQLGVLNQEEKEWIGMSYREFLQQLIGSPNEKDLKQLLCDYLRIDPGQAIVRRLEWLGLLSEEPLPLPKGSALELVAARMIEKLQYAEGERDMIVLQHEFAAGYPSGEREKITSTLIDFGVPGGDSSMARTVGLPAAIGTKLILEGRIKERGVHIPVLSDIYKPILLELRDLGIAFKEKREKL
ncbi:MAG: saccharopine dehydrogenase NADP-binding domain-containing protein [Dethiobacter sp.]|jgi:saccharopine dehydrogenase (NADP+, L-glutamate forming)/spermidine synthase|nr:saccharopine dehydrogenase NADP-binding domain-containing protein [Dethiobacter sp.]